jgi:steroid 5-alpha reductase family enzyme
MDGSAITLIAALSMILVMGCAWIVARAPGKGGWIDVFWSFGIGAMGVAFALTPVEGAAWPTTRQIVVAILVGAWGLRLGVYLAGRVAHGPEDARYAGLREAWGQRFPVKLLGFAMIQALAAIFLALTIRLAARNPAEGFRVLDLIGAAILLLAILGEGAADRQLAAFKQDPANRGKVCDVGLWSWSRHPNYFFEFLGWVAYVAFAVDPGGGDPLGYFAILGPAFIYLLLRYVSGVPPLERHMLKSRGDAYRDYQARTSAFLPMPPGRQPIR